jgi:hypothetical protein
MEEIAFSTVNYPSSFGGSGAVAGRLSYEDMAASAYRAYAASTGNKNFQGNPMPSWGELPQKIRTAWEAATRHTLNLAAENHASLLYVAQAALSEILEKGEQSWNGWTPLGIEPE